MTSSPNRREHDDSQALFAMGRSLRRIAVLRFSSLGDIVLTSPILTSLQETFPGLELIYVTKSGFEPLIEDDPRISKVISHRPDESLVSLMKRIRAERVDAILDLHGKWRGLACRLSHPWTPYETLRKPSLWEQLGVRMGWRPVTTRRPIVERYFETAERLLKIPLKRSSLSLHLGDDTLEEFKESLPISLRELQNSILIVPGAQWATKRWPLTNYVKLTTRLNAQGYHVVCTGSPNEMPLLQELTRETSATLIPPMKLKLLPHLIAHARAFIGHDSGPMHIARSVGTPTVVLFSCTASEQFDFTGHELIENPPPCSPCHFYGRPSCPKGHLKCINDIRVEEVVSALNRLPDERLPLVTF